MEETSCLIDVIVPVYNGESYLEKCVDSLLAQDFDDYGITLVDDGSTDGSGALCDDYAARFPRRVRVIHKENGGPAAARNTAVNSSQAALVAYVDSDDFVSERYLSSMYEAMGRFDVSMVIAPVCKTFIRPDGSLAPTPPPTRDAGVLSRTEALEELCYEKYFSSFPVGKLLRRELALAHPFPDGRYFEDSFILFRQIMDCDRVAYIPEISYFYYQRPGSIQRSFFEKRHQDLLDASMDIVSTFRAEHMPQAVLEAGMYKLLRGCYVTLFHAAELDFSRFSLVYQKAAPLWKPVCSQVMKNPRLTAREQVLFRLMRHCRLFYGVVKALGGK